MNRGKKQTGDNKITRDERTWSLMDVLKEATIFLAADHLENPRLDAERLLGHVLGLPRIELYLRFEQPLTPEEREKFKQVLHRRAAHEPLQHIIGETEFMSLPFKVSPVIMIPRPETETLVEKIIETGGGREQMRVLDIGTGCGNITVSLAKYLPNAEIHGVDINQNILAIAQENGRINEVEHRISWILADVKSPTFAHDVKPPYEVIVSNPPYVSKEEWTSLPREIREFEPRSAICDESDGLTFYQEIARKGISLLKKNGQIFYEVGYQQGESVCRILLESGYHEVGILPDLNGIDRVVMGTWR